MENEKHIAYVGCYGYAKTTLREAIQSMDKEYIITKIMSIFKDGDYKVLSELTQDKLDYILENALDGKYITFLNAINDEQHEIEFVTMEELAESLGEFNSGEYKRDVEVETRKTKQKSWNKKKFWEQRRRLIIAKTELTKKLERDIWKTTQKQGTFGCFEVTIGWFGKERVDYITYNTKGEFRCYEVKVSKADFNSKAKKTFVGHFNYFVMPQELYDEVKNVIPNHIGVYIGQRLEKRAKRQELGVDEQVLKDSMIRSLYREFEKQYKSSDETIVENLNRRIHKLEKSNDDYRRKNTELKNGEYEEKVLLRYALIKLGVSRQKLEEEYFGKESFK